MKDDAIVPLLMPIAGHLMPMNELIHYMKSQLEFHQKLKAATMEVEPAIELPSEIAIAELYQKRDANREAISELLDEITKINVHTASLLRESNDLYNYAVTNPLKKFVPPTRKFDGKTYIEFESEFMLYYRMISGRIQ